MGVQHFPRTSVFFRRYLTHRVDKFCTQTPQKGESPVQKEKAAFDLDQLKVSEGQRPPKLKVTSHLELHKAGNKSFHGNSDKPLVVLFQWLYAKPSAVSKYCDLYHDIGLDVLTVRGKLAHFLWPPEGMKLSQELFDYLKSQRPADEKFIVHAFSVGAYNYTIAMQAAHERPKESGHFRDRVVGQILDSIVIGTYENMSVGIGAILPKNKAFQRMVHHTLGAYYSLTHHTTTAAYERLVHHFKTEPLRVPTLLVYSHDDPMCHTPTMEGMLSDWTSRHPGFDVTPLSWPESRHAAHLVTHREDYVAAWRRLMEKLKVLS